MGATPGTAAAPGTGAAPGGTAGTHDPDAETLDWVAHRRWLLTANLRAVTTAHLGVVLEEPFDDCGYLVAMPDSDLQLPTLVRWALTDVAWLFADLAAPSGDTRTFLLDAGESDPGEVGVHLERGLPDLRRLLAIAAAAEAGPDEYESPYAEVVTRICAVFMGLNLAWPRHPGVVGPVFVDGLLGLMTGWARKPEQLGVWNAHGLLAGIPPVALPRKALLMARAAEHLEETYAAFYRELAAQDVVQRGLAAEALPPKPRPAPEPVPAGREPVDDVVDLAAAAWEALVADAPDLLRGAGTTPATAPGGLDLGLQASFMVASHFLALPGDTPRRRLMLEHLRRTRWDLTIGTLDGLGDIGAQLPAFAASTSTVSQCRLLVRLCAQAHDGSGRAAGLAPALVRAMVALADWAVRYDGRFELHDLGAVVAFRDSLTTELRRHLLDPDEPEPRVPAVWHPAMDETLARVGPHPLLEPCEALTSVWEDVAAMLHAHGFDMEDKSHDVTFAAGLVSAVVSRAEPDPVTFAAATVLHDLAGLDRGAIWSARGLAQLAAPVEDAVDVLEGLLRAVRGMAAIHPWAAGYAEGLAAAGLHVVEETAALVTPNDATVELVRAVRRRFVAG